MASRLRDLAALAGVMTRFWLLILPLVRSQLHVTARAAEAIPDPELRAHALATLRSERLSAAGAGLISATSERHDPALVRALVAFQIIWDYLDTLAEQPADDPVGNGVHLHRALIDALDDRRPHADYYRLHRVNDDGGYLVSLVQTCRDACATLPTYERVRRVAAGDARRAEVQGFNHAPADQRVPALRRWAATRSWATSDAAWFELAAASSSSLGLLVLLAAAASPTTTDAAVQHLRTAYFPWVDALTTLLDSFVDRAADAVSGDLNFIAHYPSERATAARLHQITQRAIVGVQGLPHGERHAVVVAGMIALHLSHASAWRPGSLSTSLAVVRASSQTATPLLIVLLASWRSVRVVGAQRPSMSWPILRCERTRLNLCRRSACARACDPSGGGRLPA